VRRLGSLTVLILLERELWPVGHGPTRPSGYSPTRVSPRPRWDACRLKVRTPGSSWATGASNASDAGGRTAKRYAPSARRQTSLVTATAVTTRTPGALSSNSFTPKGSGDDGASGRASSKSSEASEARRPHDVPGCERHESILCELLGPTQVVGLRVDTTCVCVCALGLSAAPALAANRRRVPGSALHVSGPRVAKKPLTIIATGTNARFGTPIDSGLRAILIDPGLLRACHSCRTRPLLRRGRARLPGTSFAGVSKQYARRSPDGRSRRRAWSASGHDARAEGSLWDAAEVGGQPSPALERRELYLLVSRWSMAPVADARPRPCRAFTPAKHRGTKVSVIPLIRRPSMRSTPGEAGQEAGFARAAFPGSGPKRRASRPRYEAW
jgi:hypothetical protein